MYRIGIGLKRLLLVAGDLIVYQLALVFMLMLRYGALTERDWELHALPFAIVSLLWVTSSYVAGLYDLHLLKNGVKFFRLYLEGMIANLAIAFAFFYLVPAFGIAPRTNLFLYFALALLLGYGWRLLYNRALATTIFKNRLLFIGPTADAVKVQHLLESSGLGLELVAVLGTSPGEHINDPRIVWYGSLDTLEDIIKNDQINTILLGHRPEDIPGLRDALYRTLFYPVTLLDRTGLEETTTGRVPLDYVSQTWFLEHLREHEKTWYEGLKRVTDILLAIPFGFVTLVITPLIALLIKLSSPGPVFYFQTRVGKGGKEFNIVKFRSMRTDAEKNGPQFTASAKTDPRLFTVGRMLRQLRIDELPQVWNVLKGELSFIGPRPERPEFVEELTRQMPYYALRHLTRPGLTGWAQVKFLTPTAKLEDNLKKLQYDLYYIKHRSPLLDLAIMLKTIGIVLRRQGT
jgi:exopolysaccharide biosynthesis polyprenyl glycosylphosphotransferase